MFVLSDYEVIGLTPYMQAETGEQAEKKLDDDELLDSTP